MKSQVTTKVGDKGTTRALDGNTYSKNHPIIECVGAVDELRAQTALLRLLILENKTKRGLQAPHYQELADFLLWLLHAYFPIGSACSDPENVHPEYHVKRITSNEIEKLEAKQLELEEQTPLPHSFIVSAANVVAAQADIACTFARRLERAIVRLRSEQPQFHADDIVIFVNRLSDFLYILARHLEHPDHQPVDYSLLA